MSGPASSHAGTPPRRVGVVGLGYVGLTLSAGFASRGYEVHGVDANPHVLEALRQARPHIFEPGLDDVIRESMGHSLFVHAMLPEDLEAAIICVSTPVDPTTNLPDLSNLSAAAAQVAERCGPETLVVVRSTVPVGTSRRVVWPILRAAWGRARLVMAPERTIQGQALRELVELPQVIGGLDEASLAAGVALFEALVSQIVPVGSLEAAELVKLANNCHTDLIYAYGNEIALIAGQHGVDPLEVIRAANRDYPRPDLAKPGFVSGSCLTKDPYLMAAGSEGALLVATARQRNEQLPHRVATTILETLRASGDSLHGRTIAVLGWAYKGWPPTDDMRGSAVAAMLPVFQSAGLAVIGHDPLVHEDVLRGLGAEPVTIADAFARADAVVLLTDHPDYRVLPVADLLEGTAVGLVYDAWRVLDERAVMGAGVAYQSIGYRSRRERA